jgi:UDP-N-acetyl-D-mannosaminuronate dehydrogenase
LPIWLVAGLRIIGIDIRADVVDTINGRRIYIFEPRQEAAYLKMSQLHNSYDDGRAAQRVAEIVGQFR